MKYSEAIRLGAMLHPQAFGALYHEGATCANGAALHAIGALKDGRYVLGASLYVNHAFPIAETQAYCPACDRFMRVLRPLSAVVVCLNNDHEWTREAIADFVEQVEAQHEAAKPVEECVAV